MIQFFLRILHNIALNISAQKKNRLITFNYKSVSVFALFSFIKLIVNAKVKMQENAEEILHIFDEKIY